VGLKPHAPSAKADCLACSARDVQGIVRQTGAKARFLLGLLSAWLKPSPDTVRKAKADPSAPPKSASLRMTPRIQGFVLPHPSVARMGHPFLVVGEGRERQLQVPLSTAITRSDGRSSLRAGSPPRGRRPVRGDPGTGARGDSAPNDRLAE